ncbi:MAG: ATP-dependent helicase, partial [Lachnospiraceae bacterium]|nr:ATP-dependent helicase [Lachnospiraceae bacterium]
MLDRAQQQAIRHVYGPCLAIAGPGAGKTHVLIRRIAHLTQDIGIPPDQLLVITFTKAAALEMKKRYLQAVPPSFSGVHFGTFHSIFFSILKEKAFFSGQNLLDSQTKRYIMKTACEKAGVDPTRIPDFFSQIDRDISFLKNTGSALSQFEPAGVSREEFRVLFETYETMRRDLRKLDFDDMQSQVRELFVKEPEALAYYQKRFRFFLVDEAQDMNRLQYDILRMFLTPPYNLFLVGDDDQAIYSFRGARPELFLGFQKDFPQAKIVSLANNYRCDKDIVKAGLSLISANAVRFPKNLVSISQLEGKIRFLPFQNERDEASGLVRLIKLEKQRQPDKSVAILYRNHVRSQLLLAELERGGLLGEGKRTHKDWFDEPCVRLVEDYLSAAAYPPKREVILRICNKPQRFLPRKGLEEEVVDFEKWAFCQTDHHAAARIRLLRQELFQIAKLPSVAAISYILYKIGCAAFAKEAGMYNDAA